MNRYILALIVPLIISFTLTPFAKQVAKMVGAIDTPKDDRRIHKKPIPRLGGLAIFLATTVSMILMLELERDIVAIIVGGLVIAISGLIDDTKEVSPKLKISFQLLASLILIYGGVEIKILTNPFSELGYINMGIMAVPITIFWVVGITNTVNLIDGMDGLSAGVSSISAITLAIISYIVGDTNISIISLIIAGAALGFLPYNFNPASIFMGDTGALYLGFMLSAVAIEGTVKGAATVAIIVPILSLGLPVFDTTFAILRRYKNKRPIMQADRGHLHHRLLDLGLGQRRTVIILYLVNIIFGAFAIVMAQIDFRRGAILLMILLAIVTYATYKLRELGKKIRDR